MATFGYEWPMTPFFHNAKQMKSFHIWSKWLLYFIAYKPFLKFKITKAYHPNMELWRFSISNSLCFARFFCRLISSKSLSSVGSSNLQQGHEQVFFNHGIMHSLWNLCLQGNSLIISSSSMSFKQMGHEPSPGSTKVKNISNRVSPQVAAADIQLTR